MQYILTEDEYNELKNRANVHKSQHRIIIQDLCTKLCNSMPVELSWDKSVKRIWGCILSEGQNKHDYCDECPCTTECPYEHKNWSK